MELTSRMKMARFQTFWIRMRKNKPLDEIRKSGQTSGTKWHFARELNYNGFHAQDKNDILLIT
ncbi:hypothetical protein Hanom_Chr10g00886591 [Helianthus anomalus]